jgi:hypothetical protein
MHGDLVGLSFHKVERVVTTGRVPRSRLSPQPAAKLVKTAHAGAETINSKHGCGCGEEKRGRAKGAHPLEGWEVLRIAQSVPAVRA